MFQDRIEAAQRYFAFLSLICRLGWKPTLFIKIPLVPYFPDYKPHALSRVA